LGCLKYLFENNIIQEDLSGIKELYCLSGGMVYILPILFGFSIDMTIQLFRRIDESVISSPESVSFDSLFTDFGLFTNTYLSTCMYHTLQNIGINPQITLKEVYEIKPILFVVKVVNVSKNKEEYISYKTHPDLPIIILLKMTTCIPLFFQCIQYKGDLYVDGGLTGSIQRKHISSSNYISLNTSTYHTEGEQITDLSHFLSRIFHICPVNEKKKRVITIQTRYSAFDFNIGIQGKDDLLHSGYQQTETWFNDYKHKHSYPHKISDDGPQGLSPRGVARTSRRRCSPTDPSSRTQVHQTNDSNYKTLIYDRWKSISYRVLQYRRHQGIRNYV